MMGIVMPETCSASNKICNKKPLLHLVGILFPQINDDARSKSHQICNSFLELTVRGVNRQRNCNYVDQTQSYWRWRQLATPNSRNKTYHETWDSHCDVAEDSSLLACYTVSLGVTPLHINTALKTWKKYLSCGFNDFGVDCLYCMIIYWARKWHCGYRQCILCIFRRL